MRKLLLAALLLSSAAFADIRVGSVTWTGLVDSFWSTPGNWDTGQAPVNGDTLVFPDGASNKAQTNDLAPFLEVQAIQFTGGGYFIGGSPVSLFGGVTSTGGFSNTIELGIRLRASQTFSGGGPLTSHLTFLGTLDLNVYALRLDPNTVFVLSGNVGGSNWIIADGSGGLLDVTSSGQKGSNFYASDANITFDGAQPTVFVRLLRGSLSGSGIIGQTDLLGTSLRPGPPAGHGILTTGHVWFQSGWGNSSSVFRLGGHVAGTNQDQVRADGVVFESAGLVISFDDGFVPTLGEQFVLFDNRSAGPVSGNLGVPEGGTSNFGTPYTFRISYSGGDGNDIVLTTLTGAVPRAPARFYTVAPCRVVDTRQAAGPLGAPALQPFARRDFGVGGVCGVPARALGIAANVTVTNPAAAGFLRLYPPGAWPPAASSISFSAGQTRANSVLIGIEGGSLAVHSASPGTVDFILDVSGYFE